MCKSLLARNCSASKQTDKFPACTVKNTCRHLAQQLASRYVPIELTKDLLDSIIPSLVRPGFGTRVLYK